MTTPSTSPVATSVSGRTEMKSCPTCNRTYPDDEQVFCLMDGSVLSAPYDPSETRAAPRRSSEPPPTEVISAPATPVEPRAPLQSTIRAPVPQVPDLHQPTVATSKQSEVTTAIPLLFRLPLATRGILGVVCILLWTFLSGWGRPWNVWYPSLAGVLAIIAGACFYVRRKTGWFLIIEGIVAVVFAGIILATSSWWRWQAAWPIVSSVLTIAAAFELRKHITKTWILAAAGLIFAVYSVGSLIQYMMELQRSWDAAISMIYAKGLAVLLSGLILTAFSLSTRGRHLTNST